MSADEAGGAVGNGDTGRLVVNHRNVAVVVGVIAGVEVPDEIVVVGDFPSMDVGHHLEAVADPPAIELRVDPAVGVVVTVFAAPPHLTVYPVEVGNQDQ